MAATAGLVALSRSRRAAPRPPPRVPGPRPAGGPPAGLAGRARRPGPRAPWRPPWERAEEPAQEMMTLTSLISLVQSDLGEEELQMRTGTANLKMTYLEKICCLAKRISRICQMKS